MHKLRLRIRIYTHSFESIPKLIEFYGFTMSHRVARKRKQSWESLVKLMNEARMKQQHSGEISSEPVKRPHELADINDIELLPAPTETVNDTLSEISSTEDEDYEETIEEDDISVLYEDWINELDLEDVQRWR